MEKSPKFNKNYENFTSSAYFSHKKSIFSYFFCYLPTFILPPILILLLAYTSVTFFYINISILLKNPTKNFKENTLEIQSKLPFSLKKISYSTTTTTTTNPVTQQAPIKVGSDKSEMYAILSQWDATNLDVLENPSSFSIKMKISSRKSKKIRKRVFKILQFQAQPGRFSIRVKEFFFNNPCRDRFFMTWIVSSLNSFGKREIFTMESLFKFHPNACLLILSNSMETERGHQILTPFLQKNFKIMAISPDYEFIFKNTVAALWFDELKKGNLDPGHVKIGQNLSNLLRIALLYKYGGIYMDTDFIVLKSLRGLKNCVGAQKVDHKTGNWTRLNNALMIFDKKHPLLRKFIEGFVVGFDGNKWGHNGPYLVSRVVRMVEEKGLGEFGFTVLPPYGFYPVDWIRIGCLFRRVKGKAGLRWVSSKVEEMRARSFAVHLWNRQSRKIRIEVGSVISRLMEDTCIFCNSSSRV